MGIANYNEVKVVLSRYYIPHQPISISLPYLARFRQCLIEYSLSTEASRRPLYNAIKYATSFPVIYLSAAQRVVVSELAEQNGGEESWKSDRVLFLLW